MGNADGVGGLNDNIASAFGGCSPGIDAFVETPTSDGWRMRFCEGAVWSDGPAGPLSGETDLQSVATHEYGHALGLGHSTVAGAVMGAFLSSGGLARDLAPDDQAGVQFVYGVKSASKPTISAAFVDECSGSIVLRGTKFSAAGNEVWFTNGAVSPAASDPRILVSGVVSDGTSIVLALPAGAGSGDVLVKLPSSGNASLSNGFPLDLSQTAPAAATSLRNGSGANPSIFAALSRPEMSAAFSSSVDASQLGSTGIAVLAVYSGALGGVPTAFGELLVDVSSLQVALEVQPLVSGMAAFSIPVPNDPTLACFGASSQVLAFISAPSSLRTLTNAVDLVVGE
jgi:hypothetical protein